MTFLYFLFVMPLPTAVFTDSHSLWFLVTYIEGQTPFPGYSAVYMLDDITVGYYDSETRRYITRGNTTNADEEVDLMNDEINKHLPYFLTECTGRSYNETEGPAVYQMMNLCELLDNDKPGQMVTKWAFQGSTVEEMHFLHDTFTFESIEKMTTLNLEFRKWRIATLYYPVCTSRLRKFLKQRATQGKRRVKPRVRLIQRANPDSGGFRVSCLATGFYPRHINLTLLRDGQPVSDHEVTGGDLLPNGDGTYQMRKSLEIRAEEREKHKYTCSATHLSLDNKLDVELDFDHGKPFKSLIPSVLTALALMLVFGVAAVIWKRRRAESSKSGYSTTFSSEENVQTKLSTNDVMS